MQFKIFTIPIYGGEAVEEALNLFLRSHKILKTEHHLVQAPEGTSWCCFIQYLDGKPADGRQNRKPEVDYRALLDAAEYDRFNQMRQRRRELAQREGVAAYVVFTNAELAEIAKLGKSPTPEQLISIPGIGEGKAKKYGHAIIEAITTDDQRQ